MDEMFYSSGIPPSYLIYGGFVFTRLTLNYLLEYGDWTNAPRNLLYKSYYEIQKVPGQEIVILSHVLVDECNISYSGYLNLQLLTVNGKEVLNMKHLNQIIEENKEKYLKFEFEENITMILNHEEALKSKERIMEKHGVPRMKSKDLETEK